MLYGTSWLSKGTSRKTATQIFGLSLRLAGGRQPNLSFIAFTATPKGKTLQLFGRTGVGGEPEPFHVYSMRQAIEEGFILDVLTNYTTYTDLSSKPEVYDLIESEIRRVNSELTRINKASIIVKFVLFFSAHFPTISMSIFTMAVMNFLWSPMTTASLM